MKIRIFFLILLSVCTSLYGTDRAAHSVTIRFKNNSTVLENFEYLLEDAANNAQLSSFASDNGLKFILNVYRVKKTSEKQILSIQSADSEKLSTAIKEYVHLYTAIDAY